MADARDLKSRGMRIPCRFDPGLRHQKSDIAEWSSSVARRAHNPKVMWFKSHLRNQKNSLHHRCEGFFVIQTGLDLPIFDYETDERSSAGKKSDRVRGTREGGFLGAAVEKIEDQRRAPDDFFGYRKRASKCNTLVRTKRRRGRKKRRLFRRSGLKNQAPTDAPIF